ncbi:unnamed protein product [Adineta steineri]|uniref:Uncharacterized protein n=1 Tax=Adineta steineri TaxID=433720 RepID=A0A813NSU7_9BILA|nr:unnamed protein product [Adineta steineri]CAF0752650.1 unnamed protein product [Adineta steineri]
MEKTSNGLHNHQVHPHFQNEDFDAIELNSPAIESPTKTSSSVKMKDIFTKSDEDKKADKEPQQLVGYLSLFRFANVMDVLYMIIGSIAALAHGAAFPLMLLVFGNITDIFTDQAAGPCNAPWNYTILTSFCPDGVVLTPENFITEYKKCNLSGFNITMPDILGTIRQQSIYLTIMGCGTIVVGYLQVAFWSVACERQTRLIRQTLLRSILTKEISYFDTHKTGQLSTRLTEDVNKLHDGIGDKVGSALQFFAGFLAGLILGNPDGIQKANLIGDIKFSNVNFVYPSRPDVPVHNGLTFTADHGHTTALVGTSGCGKSTCMQLLQRFYNPISGLVAIDGTPVDQYNLRWLRQHIGIVSQEPILFQTTIKENIRFGNMEATKEQIEQAAQMANAHDFIMQLPEKYDTLVGERGAQLSGGQKQRIAIARALVRDPRILLLDEATSALDTESERVVQDALDRASKGRTTIVIAHRLSTIINASKIIVINKGSVVEEGSHQALMDAKGVYYGLVQAQNLRNVDGKEVEEDADLTEPPPYDRTRTLSNQHQTSVDEKDGLTNDDESSEKMEYSGPAPFVAMLKMNRPELIYIIFGCISCICNGGVQPAFGVILSKIIAVFQVCDQNEQEKQVLMYILLFIGLGVLMLITNFFQSFLFAISGESLTQRLRSKIFRVLLQQDVAYFDLPENNTGALCTRLATEASAVQGATGIRIGTMLQNISNLGVGMILAFIYGWSLTLLMLAFIPFMIIAGFLQTYLMTGFANSDKKALENAGKTAVEAISNIRTVAQLTKEQYFDDEYCRLLEVPYKNSIKRAHVFGILFSFTDAIMFFAQAALFTFGAWRVEQGAMTFENIMLVMNCILFGAMAVGQTASMSPDYSKAISASKNILTLFLRQPEINNSSNEGKVLDNFDGHIKLQNIEFCYPNRPKVQVLKDFNLTIKPNKQIALVGASGCGKSTIIQLLEHFYNPKSGQILIDKNDLLTLNLQWWRSQIGFVSQEPILFDASIRENIAYGDTSRTISLGEIQEAAKNANIHQFIVSLPDQYDTNVGSKGTQLSGGEKQRIAIARALIRNPKILLLDEATSALDTESERVVQEALDQASKGRTTIVIAHRLSTIQNSDLICVLRRGKIVESGGHDELLARKEYYYRLAQAKK